MSEFGGRSELGRKSEGDNTLEKRRRGDWSKDLDHTNSEVLAKRANIFDLLGSRPVETAKTKSDPLRECAGESDAHVFSSSPFTQSPPNPPTTQQKGNKGGDWSLDLLMPDGTRARDSKKTTAKPTADSGSTAKD